MKKVLNKIGSVLREAITIVFQVCALALMAGLFALAMTLVPFFGVGMTVINGESISSNMSEAFKELMKSFN